MTQKNGYCVLMFVFCMALLTANELHASPSDAMRDPSMDIIADSAADTTADTNATITPAMLLGATPISDQQLNAYRGGFFNGGLMLSLGIERVLYINGQLTTTMALNPTLPANIDSSAGARASTPLSSHSSVLSQGSNGQVQVMTNLNFSAPLSVQNHLPHQTIGIVTVINAATNTASLLKTLNFSSTLRDAINATAH